MKQKQDDTVELSRSRFFLPFCLLPFVCFPSLSRRRRTPRVSLRLCPPPVFGTTISLVSALFLSPFSALGAWARPPKTQNRSGGDGMDAMALEDNTEAAVSADANDAESDRVIEQFLTGERASEGAKSVKWFWIRRLFLSFFSSHLFLLFLSVRARRPRDATAW